MYQVSYNYVSEKRAPTDESVRLLKELEKEAKDKVLSAEKLDNNLIHAKVWTMQNILSYKDEFKILMNINGKQFTHDMSIEIDTTKHVKLEKIYEVISKRIAAELMNSVAAVIKN